MATPWARAVPDEYGESILRLACDLPGATAPAGEPPGAASFDFKPRALFSHDAFQRGLELLRLGLGSEARREFQSIGIGVADAKAATAPSPQSESEELLWLASVLFDRAGAWYLSHAIPRHLLTDWQRHYPVGNWRKYWLLAYPRGFYDILAAAARENGQPEALQLAIVREESAFDPRTESFANAVGLTQMIQPTAKRFSGGQVNISNGDFVFSLTESYLIEDGRLTAPLKGVNLIGNGPDVLNQVSMLGNDFALSDGIWTCGKEGQSVPVGIGTPSVKIAAITVGGTKA